MKKSKLLLMLLIVIMLSTMVVACGEDSVTITFMLDDVIYETISVESGEEFTYPQDPTKGGYTFVGWSKDDDSILVFTETTITEDVVLYAKWVADSSSSDTETSVDVDLTVQQQYDAINWGSTQTNTESLANLVEQNEDVFLSYVYKLDNGSEPTSLELTEFKEEFLEAGDGYVDATSSSNYYDSYGVIGYYDVGGFPLAFEVESGTSQTSITAFLNELGLYNFEYLQYGNIYYSDYNWAYLLLGNYVEMCDLYISLDGKTVILGNNVADIVIPYGITNIADEAFYDCYNLSSVAISQSVTSIGGDSFAYCSSLTSIALPQSIISIDAWAFDSCDSLVDVYYDSTIADWCSISFGGSYSNPMAEASNIYMLDESGKYYLVTDLTIPNSITQISSFTFYGFDCLLSLILGDGVTSIGCEAFAYCTNLTSISISSIVTEIEGYVFSGCTNLTIYCESASAPVAWDAYWNIGECTVVWGVVGSDDVESDDEDSNEPLTIQDQYDAVNWATTASTTYSLQYCVEQNEDVFMSFYYYVNYDEYPTDAELLAFKKEVSASYSYVEVTSNSEYYSYGLSSYYDFGGFPAAFEFASTTSEAQKTAFLATLEDGETLSYSQYGNIYYMNDAMMYLLLGNYVEIGDLYISLDGTTVVFCNDAEEIVIPNGVTTIMQGAFYQCTSLTSLVITASVDSVSAYAFSNCTNLTSVTFSDTSTWYRTTSSTNYANKTGGYATTVTSTSTAATYLKSTYCDYYWYKL